MLSWASESRPSPNILRKITADPSFSLPELEKHRQLNSRFCLIKTHNLLDTWRYKNPHSFGPTWANPRIKIICRLDHLFVSNQPSIRIYESKIIPNIYSDHSAVVLSISFSEHEPSRGPGFWQLVVVRHEICGILEFLNSRVRQKASGNRRQRIVLGNGNQSIYNKIFEKKSKKQAWRRVCSFVRDDQTSV